VNTPERLDELFNNFYANPTIMPEEAYILSEPIAFWKAVALITTDARRLEIRADIADDPPRVSHWANELRVPENIVQALIGPRYEDEVSQFMASN